MSYIRPIKLGSLSLSKNIFYAPLAGCSDLPFRKMSASYHPGLMYCEMVKMDALIRHEPTTYRLLHFTEDMHPIGAQLCGSKPSIAGECAKIVEDLGFDVVDLNCGCPVDKITKDNSGSGLLKYPELIGEILSNMIRAVKIPVTVKIRIGWDEHHIVAPLITKIAEEVGAKAICIHGRTREQGYKGDANWDYIKECKEIAKDIIVIGNGDVFTAEAAIAMFEYTNCDAVLVSRGTLGQPWIVEDIIRKTTKSPLLEKDGLFYKKTLLSHLSHIESYQNGKKAITDLRRVGCWYVKNEPKAKTFREHLNQIKSIEEGKSLIESYPWESAIELS
ncbi:MAG: tRNA dihydrouridine synthase DusB [Chlamydiales bacterium]|nr:tRNA dihydrouridine synthase DusB [Chlamydiales bacterium]